MKALVLADGTGTRLRPLSHSMPKQLAPVANRPVLFHGLDPLREAGITDIGIVVSAPGTAIRTVVGDGTQFGARVTYLPQEEPRGLAHCVKLARTFLGDDDFVMYLGDNVFADGLVEALGRFADERPDAQLLVHKVVDPSRYGVVEVDSSGLVLGLEEKPVRPRSDLAVTGAYFFTPEIHEAVGHIEPSWRNEWEITDAVQWLVAHDRRVTAQVYGGYWKDTGTITDLLECNRVLLEGVTAGVLGTVDTLSEIRGSVVVGAGARIERSVVVGPTIIGAGCEIGDSFVGPYTSIAAGCRLNNAGVEYSILSDRASVWGVRGIEQSVIGRACEVRQAAREGHASHHLVLGDDSRIEVAA